MISFDFVKMGKQNLKDIFGLLKVFRLTFPKFCKKGFSIFVRITSCPFRLIFGIILQAKFWAKSDKKILN